MIVIGMILKCDQTKLSICSKPWLSSNELPSFDQSADQPKTFRMLHFWARFIFSLYSLVDFLWVYKDWEATAEVAFHSRGCGSPMHCQVLGFFLLNTKNRCHTEHPFFIRDPCFLYSEHPPKTGEGKSENLCFGMAAPVTGSSKP